MKLPTWLKPLNARDERLRAAHGLYPIKDGWYKSVDGRMRYICKPCSVAEAAAALPGRLEAIRAKTRVVVVGSAPVSMTLKDLINRFLAAMLERHRTSTPKRLARRTYDDYVDVLDRFAAVVGDQRLVATLGPDDFSKFAATWEGRAMTTRRREIQYIDRLFNWAGPGPKAMNLIPMVRRGPAWVKPSDDDIRTAGVESDKAYTMEELRAAFEAVAEDPLLNAAAHLGFGSGFIPKDIADLTVDRVDLEGAVILFPRGKTGVGRICPLVTRAVAALRKYVKARPPGDDGLFFRTHRGNPLARTYIDEQKPGLRAREENQVSKRWSAVVGQPFTGLRTTFAALADDWPDPRAIDMVMGHKVGKVGKHIRVRHYAHQFNPQRVRDLVEHVWRLVFGPGCQESDQAVAVEAGMI